MAFETGVNAPYPPMTRRLRLGFVGGGRGALVGEWHALGARISGRWDIVAGALSSDPEKAALSAQDWLIAPERSYASFAEMAKAEAARDDGVDAVAICTPNHLHAPAVEAFLRAGIDVICDKPLTAQLDEAQKLLALQRETGRVLALTYPYIYHPMAAQARDMVLSGAIGALRQLHVEYLQDWATGDESNAPGRVWRRDPAKVGRASAVGDIGTHAFHMACFVSGRAITNVRADFHVCGGPKPMEDTAFMNIRLDNGAPGSLWVSQAAPGNACGLRLRLYGDKGGLEWDQEQPEYLHYTPLNEAKRVIYRGHGAGVGESAARMLRLPRGHGEGLSDAWGNLYREAAIAIEARQEGRALPEGLLQLPDALDGARGVKFVDACADSHEAGGVWTSCWLES